jgi:hypothetical protein
MKVNRALRILRGIRGTTGLTGFTRAWYWRTAKPSPRDPEVNWRSNSLEASAASYYFPLTDLKTSLESSAFQTFSSFLWSMELERVLYCTLLSATREVERPASLSLLCAPNIKLHVDFY